MSIAQQIEQRLSGEFAPDSLVVANESHMHNVPPDSETHFKVTLVTERFVGMNKVKRHQAVYGLLQDLLAGPVHALALHTYSPEEWATTEMPESPPCLGGAKREQTR